MDSSSPEALQVFAVWVSAREGDDPRGFEDLLRDHPDLAAELEELYGTWKRLVAAGADESHSATPAPGAAAQGTKLGRYTLEGEIARGGMGSILRAWDADLRRHLAIKVSLEGDRARALARFVEEARITGQLDHPGVVPVHELGLDSDGRTFFTMKLVEGRDLRHVLADVFAERNGWNETRALGVILKVCEAVAYAHKKGVVHRDLKPANVMIGSFGEVFVMDWGLARALGREDLHDLRLVTRSSNEGTQADSPIVTMDGDVLGTPAYMPPEQARGEIEKLSPRSDVYSLGAMLYHILARRMPYEDSLERTDPRRVLARVRAGPPDPVHGLNPSVPAELVAICDKAMARETQDRYPDTLALAEDLRSYLERRVVTAYETGALADLRKWIVRNRAIAAASAAAIGILLVGLVVSSLLFTYARAETARADKEAKDLIRANAALVAATNLAEEKSVEAERERGIAKRRADDVLSLSAAKDLEDIVAAADALWPSRRALVPKYEVWLRDARALIEGRPADPAQDTIWRPGLAEHRAKLGELEARALSRTVDGSSELEFQSSEDRWWHAQLAKLVADLEAFCDPASGLLSAGTDPEHGWGVERRLDNARSLEQRSFGEPAAARLWAEVIRSIQDPVACPAYAGLSIVPQLGLLPVGRDPESGLHEFAHLETGAPAARGADGRLVLEDGTGLVFVLIPSGTSWMGAQAADPMQPNFDPAALANEGPVHEVVLDPFFLSKFEMTQEQWRRFAGKNPSTYRPDMSVGGKQTTALHPVEQVSWIVATELLSRLELELPTEAQWEWAARAGTQTAWWTGSDKASLAGAANLADAYAKAHGGPAAWRYDEAFDDGYLGHAPVGHFRANGFGLHDVLGNVNELCREYWGLYDQKERPGDGERQGPAGNSRMIRGGSYLMDCSRLRMAFRMDVSPDYRDHVTGLRPARRLAK